MKQKYKESLKGATQIILEFITAGALITRTGAYLGGFRDPKLVQAFTSYRRRHIRHTIKRLIVEKIIINNESTEHQPLRLTQKGLMRIRRKKWLNLFSQRSWDYLWRIFIFDIPESRKIRKKIQRELIALGFFKLQKSIYVWPHPCEKEMDEFIKQFKIWKQGMLLVSPTLGPWEREVRNYFFKK